ncbi:MAG: patatin-like phospholipase family protein [Planctomycetota bacterium]
MCSPTLARGSSSPTIRGETGDAHIIRIHENDRSYGDCTAAAASAATPTYFDPAVVSGEISDQIFVDGGLWSNSPVLPAVAEAVGNLRVPIERIDVLNIGTLRAAYSFSNALGKGKAAWAKPELDFCLVAQETGAEKLATNLLGPTRFLRIDQQPAQEIKLDDTSAIDDLRRIGQEVAEDTSAKCARDSSMACRHQ